MNLFEKVNYENFYSVANLNLLKKEFHTHTFYGKNDILLLEYDSYSKKTIQQYLLYYKNTMKTEKNIKYYLNCRYNHFLEWSELHPEICKPHLQAITQEAKRL